MIHPHSISKGNPSQSVCSRTDKSRAIYIIPPIDRYSDRFERFGCAIPARGAELLAEIKRLRDSGEHYASLWSTIVRTT